MSLEDVGGKKQEENEKKKIKLLDEMLLKIDEMRHNKAHDMMMVYFASIYSLSLRLMLASCYTSCFIHSCESSPIMYMCELYIIDLDELERIFGLNNMRTKENICLFC